MTTPAAEVPTTVGELVSAISRVNSAEAAQQILRACKSAYPESAEANIGYCIGYIGGSNREDAERRAQLHKWFGVSHPVFGGGDY